MSVRGEKAFTSKRQGEGRKKRERKGKVMREIVDVKSEDVKRERLRGWKEGETRKS